MSDQRFEKGQDQTPRAGMSPAKVLALGFFLIIAGGCLLLMLPFASRSGQGLRFLDALFTAASATCLTGLTVVDTFTRFSLFGQLVILCLIQVGGLGFMLFATLALVALGRRISLHSRVLIRESLAMPGLSGGVRTSLHFLLIALSVEALGAVLLSLRFVPMYGLWRGVYFGLFHAISAFCNAGFDLFGAAGSLQLFRGDPLVLLTVCLLVMLGGLGFMVISDLLERRSRQLRLHTRIVLVTNTALIAFGLVMFAVNEWHNPLTLARQGAGAGEKLLNAFFQAVTTRTAGFFSFDQAAMSETSKLVSTVLMFIGASPASTGGGVKTSSFFVVIMVLIALVYGREDINAFGRRLPAAIGRTAQTILFLYLSLLILGAMLLTMTEAGSGKLFIDLLFEETSALGTVGLSTAGTPSFRDLSRLLLIALMYFGRVGPLTMMLTLSHRSPSGGAIRYPEEQIVVG